MHNKFLAHGTGSGAGAARYLLGEKDHNGNVRAEVKVLRGDPVMVGKVADSLHFKNKYTSGVIAFHKNDKPTDEQINEAIDDHERVAFAGIDLKRVARSYILHRDKDGSCHIHYFGARVDLQTGKSLNIAPPGWEKSFDPMRDYLNHKYGWARPDDPDRARNLQPGKRALIDAQMLKRGLEIEPDTKALFTEYLEQQIVAGNVKDRESMLSIIKKAGIKVNRAGKDYITIVDDDGNKFRLKGAIYGIDWNAERTLEIENSRGQNSTGQADPGRAARARKELEEAIQRRTKYNQDRYGGLPAVIGRYAPEHLAEPALVAVMADGDQHHPVTVNSGHSELVELVEAGPSEHPSANQTAANGTTNPAVNNRVLQQSSRSQSLQKGVENDGIRDDIIRVIEQIKQRFRSASEAVSRAIGLHDGAIGRYDEELHSVKSTNGGFVEAVRAIKTGVKQVTENNINEIEHFKRHINLVEFAETFGYVKDAYWSSPNSTVMRSGKDKIVIATEDSHGIYLNVNDDTDQGSIIDFLQKRKGLNLGQVRKELRPWIGVGSTVIQRKPVEERPPKPREVSRDQATVLKDYHHLWEYQIGYLEHERKLSPDTVKAFLDVIRTDDRGNTCFTHCNSVGDVTGWEVRNKEFKGFSPGSKSLCVYSPDGQSERLIICESMIDCMSYYQLQGKPGDVYASFAGGVSGEQRQQLETLCEGFKDVCIATDNDEAGHKFTNMIHQWRPDAKRALPGNVGDDWNQVLKDSAPKTQVQRGRAP